MMASSSSEYTTMRLLMVPGQEKAITNALKKNRGCSIRFRKCASGNGDSDQHNVDNVSKVIFQLNQKQLSKYRTASENSVVSIRFNKSDLREQHRHTGGFIPILIGLLGSVLAGAASAGVESAISGRGLNSNWSFNGKKSANTETSSNSTDVTHPIESNNNPIQSTSSCAPTAAISDERKSKQHHRHQLIWLKRKKKGCGRKNNSDNDSDSAKDAGETTFAYKIESDPSHPTGAGLKLSPFPIRRNSMNDYGSGLYLTPHTAKHVRGGSGLMMRMYNRNDLRKHCNGFTSRQYNAINNLV